MKFAVSEALSSQEPLITIMKPTRALLLMLVCGSLPWLADVVRGSDPAGFAGVFLDEPADTLGVAPFPGELFSDGTSPAPAPLPIPGPIETVPPDEFSLPGAQYLPPLHEELQRHGGDHLYTPSDIQIRRYRPADAHLPLLRLPENWLEPQPLALPYPYLDGEFITWDPWLKWFGRRGYQWEPRLVVYGSYELFAAAYQQGGERRDGIGHQLLLDADLPLTGTERFHVQFRPLGRDNTGGSILYLSDPHGYDDNSTLIPQRWWFEGELQSIFGSWITNPRVQLDVNVTAGQFPFTLHNGLLMNDDITGIVLGKNTFTSTPFSNINTQVFYAFDDVDAFPVSSDLFGVHLTGDYRLAFLEFSYSKLLHGSDDSRDSEFYAFSGTKFFGPLSLTGRAMFKEGDEGGSGDGQLFVLESNHTLRPPDAVCQATGVELMVSYLNVFKSTSGWNPISGGNYNRVRNLFVVNPLLAIAAGVGPADRQGVVLGSQLFRHSQDESWIPEVAYEDVAGESAWGVGLRYQRIDHSAHLH